MARGELARGRRVAVNAGPGEAGLARPSSSWPARSASGGGAHGVVVTMGEDGALLVTAAPLPVLTPAARATASR